MAQEASFRDVQVASGDIAIREIQLADLWQSLREGYEDFTAKPTFVHFLFLVYPASALLLTLLFRGEDMLPLAFPILAGTTLLGPIVCVGLFEISRRRELGDEIGMREAFGFIHTSAFAPVLALSLFMMVLYGAWLFMAQFIWDGLFGANTPATLAEFVNELTSTRRGAALIIYGNVVGFMFAFVVMMTSVVAFPFLIDRPATSWTAMSVSMRAVTHNLLPMAVWGLVVVGLLLAGAVVLLVGLAVVLPILGHATWHLYRKLIEH